jgi:hypothetical protein
MQFNGSYPHCASPSVRDEVDGKRLDRAANWGRRRQRRQAEAAGGGSVADASWVCAAS